jgi:SWI/SNF-related matrix-associated actin-dependent regulator of chromatin subfamily A-like protein 1
VGRIDLCWPIKVEALIPMADDKGEEKTEQKTTGAAESTQLSPEEQKRVDDFLYAPPPRIPALKEFQVRAAEHMIRWTATINASPCGSGKTLVSIAVIDALDLFPALIVCSKRVSLQWAGEFLRWLAKEPPYLRTSLTVSVLEGTTVRSFEGEYFYTLAGDQTVQIPINDLSADVIIAPYSVVYDWAETLAPIGLRVLVIDELRIRSRRTYQYFACKYLADRIVHTKYFRHIYGLSADSIVNRPLDYRGILEVLGRMPSFGNWNNFARRYCGGEVKIRIQRDGRIRRYIDFNGSSNELELHKKLKNLGIMFRLTEQECLPGMPDKIRIMVPVTLSNKAEYARAENDLMSYVREMALADKKFNAQLELMTEEQLMQAVVDLRRPRTGDRRPTQSPPLTVNDPPSSVSAMKELLRDAQLLRRTEHD